MNIKNAYDLLAKEYLSKIRPYGCDGCMAELFCIENMYKKSRSPQEDCPERLKEYLRRRRYEIG